MILNLSILRNFRIKRRGRKTENVFGTIKIKPQIFMNSFLLGKVKFTFSVLEEHDKNNYFGEAGELAQLVNATLIKEPEFCA